MNLIFQKGLKKLALQHDFGNLQAIIDWPADASRFYFSFLPGAKEASTEEWIALLIEER